MPEIASAKLSIDERDLPPPGARVLDVGCGDGRHLLSAAQRGCRAIGADYDPDELRRARLRLGRHAVDLVAADATRLPFRSGTFDAVICTETLEHLPDDRGAMREIARALKQGGTLLGAVPSHFTELVYFRLSPGYRTAPGGHIRIYAPRLLIHRLRNAGLRVRSTRYLHFVDSLVWLRYVLSDAVKPTRPRSAFEAAVLLAVAQERPVPTWRTRLRSAIASSWFIGRVDRLGALLWPKSFAFVAVKSPTRETPAAPERDDATRASPADPAIP